MIIRSFAGLAACAAIAMPAFAQDAAPAAAQPPVPTPAAAPAPEAPVAAPVVAAPVATPVPIAKAAAPTGSANVPPPAAGKGQVVFFRASKFQGSAVSFKVRENKVELGLLSSGAYFILPAEPGAHAYEVHSEATDTLNIEVEPGETYYVVGTISMGLLVGRPNLSPADAKAFDTAFPKLKVSSLDKK
jgi:hypothetical protein